MPDGRSKTSPDLDNTGCRKLVFNFWNRNPAVIFCLASASMADCTRRPMLRERHQPEQIVGLAVGQTEDRCGPARGTLCTRWQQREVLELP